MKASLVRGFIISTFVSLYLVVSIISTVHVIDFFKLSNPDWLAISLAIAFEIGAAASLASIIALEKMNKSLIWFLFFVLTVMQMMGNTYYAFTHLENYQSWVELFGLAEEEPMYQKRMLSILSGAILPLVALGFIKSLIDYLKPEDSIEIINSTGVFPQEDSPQEDSPQENDEELETASLLDFEKILEEDKNDSPKEDMKTEETETTKFLEETDTIDKEDANINIQKLHPQLMSGVNE